MTGDVVNEREFSAGAYAGGGASSRPTPNYGTFYAVYPTDRRGSSVGTASLIGILIGVSFAAMGVLVRDSYFVAASIMFAVSCVVGARADSGWSRRLVTVALEPHGSVSVRPSALVTVLRVATVVTAVVGLVLFGLSLLSGAAALSARMAPIACSALIAIATVGGRHLFTSPKQECMVIGEKGVLLCGKDNVSYAIPWSDEPVVVGQRQRTTLLIKAGDDVECPISFDHLRVLPSRVKSLLAFYQRSPEARERLASVEAVDDVLKGLGW